MRSISNDEKKNHSKLCSPVKRGILTIKQPEHSTLRKDGCDNLAYAILTRASTKARMLTWISPQQHQCQEVFSLDGVVSMTSAEVFQEVVHAFLVIGRNTITIADMDPDSVALNDRAGSICWKD